MYNRALKKIYIIGAGGFGREVLDTIHEINKKNPVYSVEGFVDEDEHQKNNVICGVKVIGNLEYFQTEICQRDRVYAVIAVGSPHVKKGIAERLTRCVEWESIVHPTVFVSETATVSPGCIIQCHSAIDSQVVLGKHCIINCNCVIGHDTIIGDHTSLMPMCGIMGNCAVAERVYIGVGSVSIQGINIGSDAIVGAGSVVIRDVEAGATVVGNPARRIK